ncbi:MAG TPA: ATP-binding protein [Bryobacteraceae bacterium]|nr:ATP-binding protein [Bryobacteraceae bacterium]
MSLFSKILAWFVVAVLITLLATSLTSILSYKPSSHLHAPFALMIALEGVEARHAWETGGRDALRQTLDRFQGVTHAYGALFTDARGIDLVSGQSQAALIGTARRYPTFFSFQRKGLVFSRFSSDGKYCFFLIISPALLIFSNFQPAHLLVIVIAVALCYALARHLTAPLRSLQGAVEKFGHGDLNARASESRRDETGDLARTFNRMAEQIQKLLSAQRRLLLDISHELRSPLARLNVAVELARSSDSGTVPLDRIQKEADRLNDLIGQMLEVARLENDPSSCKLERLRLDELVGALVEACSIEAQARRCILTWEAPAAVSIDGDRELLRRAIENVVRNAIRYAPVRTKVEVALENGNGTARLKIRDYGPGVPESALIRIFEPFYRVEADRNRSSGGSGLGLSIARRAVELHHGSLHASNAAPGLLVEIELPV